MQSITYCLKYIKGIHIIEVKQRNGIIFRISLPTCTLKMKILSRNNIENNKEEVNIKANV